MSEFKPDHYYKYHELTDFLQSLAASYPELAQVESIGKTTQNRDIWLLTVTDLKAGRAEDKPAVWIDANTHAGEVAGCQAALYFANRLLTQTEDAVLADLVRHLTFYIVPRIAADGAEMYLTSPHMLRSTPVKWPNEDRVEGHYQQDINQDGRILMMRKKDPAGSFKISAKNKNVMIARTHDEWSLSDSGSNTDYYHLYTEGEFHQFDGFKKTFSRDFGLDLNRQFGSGFLPEGEQAGAGPYPQFLPEAQALVKAVTARPNISVAHTYHTYGGMVLRLPALYPDEQMNPNDLHIFKTVCDTAAKAMGYKVYSVYKDFQYAPKKITTGSFDEWLYGHRGIVASTIEIWDVAKAAGVCYDNALDCYASPNEEQLLAIYNWCESHLPPGSFHVPWQVYQHPQLGEIEIGGWDWKFIFQNPPPSFLKTEVEKVFQGTLTLAKACPVVKLISQTAVPISNTQWKVHVIFSNQGFLPTNGTAHAVKTAAARKPFVKLNLSPEQKVISGKTNFEIEPLAGRSARGPRTTPVLYSEMPNLNECRLEWIIEGPGALALEVNFGRGGILKTSIILTQLN